MLVVALAALGSAGWVLVERSSQYLLLARVHERRAANCRALAASYRVLLSRGNADPDLPRTQKNAFFLRMAIEVEQDARFEANKVELYRLAARFPWLGPPRILQNESHQ
jgi:hypothetical protein